MFIHGECRTQHYSSIQRGCRALLTWHADYSKMRRQLWRTEWKWWAKGSLLCMCAYMSVFMRGASDYLWGAEFTGAHCVKSVLICCTLQVKQNHAGLSDKLLRIVRALDALEGRFAEQSHHHNSKTHQIHEALSRDLTQLEAVFGSQLCRYVSYTQIQCHWSWQVWDASVECWDWGHVTISRFCFSHTQLHTHPLQQQE